MTTSTPPRPNPRDNSKSDKSGKGAMPRPVTLVVAAPGNGRIAVTVTVVPVADLDAQGGVFVDLRTGTKLAPEPMKPEAAPGASPAAMANNWLAKGDEAVAGLLEKEVAAEKVVAAKAAAAEAQSAKIATDKTGPMAAAKPDAAPAASGREAMKGKGNQEPKPPLYSHQIAQGLKLTVGQAESFRAEIAVPNEPPEGEAWFVRARFATTDGHDLKSSWQRI